MCYYFHNLHVYYTHCRVYSPITCSNGIGLELENLFFHFYSKCVRVFVWNDIFKSLWMQSVRKHGCQHPSHGWLVIGKLCESSALYELPPSFSIGSHLISLTEAESQQNFSKMLRLKYTVFEKRRNTLTFETNVGSAGYLLRGIFS